MRAEQTHVEKLQTLDDRLARLRSERGRLVARASHAARTLDTRRKIWSARRSSQRSTRQ